MTTTVKASFVSSQKSPNSADTSHAELFLCISGSDIKCDTTGKSPCTKGCYTVANKFNYVFDKNCYFINKKTGRAITPKYITVYDRRDESVTYLKLKNDKGIEYLKVKKHIEPKANREMYLMIIAKDTGYSITCGSEEYFMEYESSFAKSIESAGSDTAKKNSPPASPEVTAADVHGEISKAEDHGYMLKSLDAALIIYNGRYPANSIIDDRYYLDVNCLRIKIMKNFSILPYFADSVSHEALIKEADSLKTLLEHIYQNQPYDKLIESIKSKYYLFISKQLTLYSIIASQLRIPDKDVFKISINRKVSPDSIFVKSMDFKVSVGFKIDFSAGVFLTGLGDPEFVAQSHSFRYKETVLTVNPNGSIDTAFTGAIKDTSGNLVHAKDPRMNYAVGFLSHAYIRTGTFTNVGFASGVLLNDNGMKIILGGSLLLSIRKSRVALSGGMSIGKQKTISPTAEPSAWNSSYKDGNIYNLKSDVPLFFNGTDVPYYEKWKTSWFFGLTYNFSSVTIHW